MLTAIYLSLAFVAFFSPLSNWATVRRERRMKNRRFAEANKIINQALHDPYGVEEWN